ncbi:MAG: S9 family peptidase [Verrucomicrobiae bacterium]|nr:S9 family peptidase [Verrucomicrobiae bacterium]
MRPFRAFWLAALAGGSLMAWGASLPEASWFQPPDWNWLRLSPDGRHVAAVADEDSESSRALWMLDSDSPERRWRVGLPDGEFPADAVWAGEDHLVVLVTQAGGGGFRVVDRRTGVLRALDFSDGSLPVRLLHPQPRVPGVVFVEGLGAGRRRTPSSGRWLDVLAVEIGSGRVRTVARNPGDVVQWLVDNTGSARAAMAARGDHRELRVRSPGGRDAAWTRAVSFEALCDPATLGALSPDGSKAWVNCRQERDTLGVVELELEVAGGRMGARVASDDRFDITAAPLMAGGSPMAATWDRERPHLQWFDTRWEEASRRLFELNPDADWIPREFSNDGAVAVFEAVSDRHAPAFAVIQRDTSTAPHWLRPSSPRPAVEGIPRAPVTVLASDGTPLIGYVTRTPGSPAGPLLVLVHGGPWTRDRWEWSPEAQFMASRGWTVLQLNYRGSAGFGRRFQEQGAGRWGATAVSDMAAGARALVDAGFADPGRVALAGGSFGGYLTLSALLSTPGAYRGGVAIAGVFDLRQWHRKARLAEPRFTARWQRHWLAGSPDGRLPELPRLGDLSAPLLLLHAADDAVVPWTQSRRLWETAARERAPVEILAWDRGGHSLGSAESQARAWQQAEAFLRQAIQD